METPERPKLPSLDEAKRAIARALAELAWNEGHTRQTIEVQYKDKDWEIAVFVKQADDAPISNMQAKTSTAKFLTQLLHRGELQQRNRLLDLQVT
jgi:hypothetical protein